MPDHMRATPRPWPADVKTLSMDVGGTRLKASVLDRDGKMLVDKVRIDTPYPCPPDVLIESLRRLVARLPWYHRASVGFPGLIRKGVVREVPALSRRKPGGAPEPTLAGRWTGFRLRDALEEAFGVPTLVANDADVQGSAVVRGDGFELVVTLGHGRRLRAVRGRRATAPPRAVAWPLQARHLHRHRPRERGAQRASATSGGTGASPEGFQWLERMVLFDRMYVGGGNARHLALDLGPRVERVSNTAGITGGIRLWDRYDGPISRRPRAQARRRPRE